MIKSVLVGGGHGGYNILKNFKDSEAMEIIGVIDVNEDAPGMQLAREMGISTSNDLESISKLKPELIIEVTGREDVLNRVKELAGDARIMDSVMAKVMMEVVEKLDRQVEMLKTQSGVIASNVKTLFDCLKDMNDDIGALQQYTKTGEDNVASVNQIIDSIRRITKETKILGINASIEAARAGEAGKGFSVVASEIQNLTRNTESSYGKIIETIEAIGQQLNFMDENIHNLAGTSEKQKAASDAVSNALRQLLENI